jgi:hypothetical protein
MPAGIADIWMRLELGTFQIQGSNTTHLTAVSSGQEFFLKESTEIVKLPTMFEVLTVVFVRLQVFSDVLLYHPRRFESPLKHLACNDSSADVYCY